MKKTIFAAVLLLLTARVARADDGEFRSYSIANYGSPFTYVPTTDDDLTSALTGGPVSSGGSPIGTFNQVLQLGPTSVSDDYQPGTDLHVAYSAAAVYRPAEPPSTAPGIGAKVSASNSSYPGSATVIGENYVYLKKSVSVNNPGDLDKLMKSYEVTISLDGVIHVSGDAIAQVGEASRITFDDGTAYTTSRINTFKQESLGIINTYVFGPGLGDPPIKLRNDGPWGIELYEHGFRSVTIETLLYLRAQTGGLERGAGTADADFSSTLRVSNIRFFDENDQVIPGLQVVGSDGEVYPYNAVPEPVTLALFGVGSVGLLFARFRRTQRA
jgi:PEP-CTERM motif